MPLSPQAYRSFARECLQWAEQTTAPSLREAFISLAKEWTLAAKDAMRAEASRSGKRPPPASMTRDP